jgi:cell division protein FtsW
VRLAINTLTFCVVALLGLGMVMLISASTGQPKAHYRVMQPIWSVIGLVACGLAAAGDYRWLKKYSWSLWGFFAVVLLLLVATLVPGLGSRANGASRWLKCGSMTLQPSELAKVALVLVLAWYGDRCQRWMPGFWRGLVIPGLLVAPVLGLVFFEPDVGTTVLLALTSGVVLFMAGTRLRFLFPLLVAGVAGLAVFILHNPMRLRRVLAFLHPDQNKEEAGYQTFQAIIAIGSGGLTGLGLGDGRQKLGFVPEHHTDFILSVIGEELGLIATLSVIVAFVLIIVCGLYIAWHARDTFGLLLGSGLTALIGFQAAINIGVATGSLPNKGLSLPFISYGGSNLVVMLACIGLLLNIARQAGEPESLPQASLEPEDQPQSA